MNGSAQRVESEGAGVANGNQGAAARKVPVVHANQGMAQPNPAMVHAGTAMVHAGMPMVRIGMPIVGAEVAMVT